VLIASRYFGIYAGKADRQRATAALIDCDSFQITDGAHVFRCPVEVPEFTPPELQGSAFDSQTRTAQHDAFGLAVLIFYLLFLGRHPFMVCTIHAEMR
jgi:DNA-binding helix-hairpin-helix protein with protein kinase domain